MASFIYMCVCVCVFFHLLWFCILCLLLFVHCLVLFFTLCCYLFLTLHYYHFRIIPHLSLLLLTSVAIARLGYYCSLLALIVTICYLLQLLFFTLFATTCCSLWLSLFALVVIACCLPWLLLLVVRLVLLLFIACLALLLFATRLMLLLLTLHIALLLFHTRYSPHIPLCCCYSLFSLNYYYSLLGFYCCCLLVEMLYPCPPPTMCMFWNLECEVRKIRYFFILFNAKVLLFCFFSMFLTFFNFVFFSTSNIYFFIFWLQGYSFCKIHLHSNLHSKLTLHFIFVNAFCKCSSKF